jgi:type VI secretion system protein ImpA
MPVNSELLTTLLTPIEGDNPSGRDLRYDPAYDAFKEERREEMAIPGSDDGNRKVADWNRVVALGTDLLGKQTKDLQLGAWMTEALLRRNGFPGLLTGLETLRGLLEQYWDTLYPEIEDDDLELRAGPLEWVGSKLTFAVQQVVIASGGITYLDYTQSRTIPLESAISDAPYDEQKSMREARAESESFGKMMPEVVDTALENTTKVFYKPMLADIDATLAALAALDKQADERFGREAPAFTGLRTIVEELRRFSASTLARKLEADPDPVDVMAEEGEGAVAVDADGPQTPEPVNRQDASQRIAVVARWFRQQDPTNPAPYAMVRGFRWGELRAGAPDIDPKLLEAPATAIRSRLKTLLLDNKWPELLEASEGLMATPSGRGWLDLQRYVLTACANLGSGHDAVAATIRSELRMLLKAVPTLPRMTLMDDTPTANDETREWLEGDALAEEPTASEAEVSGEAAEGADTELSDGADVTSEAIEDDQGTSHQGGFARQTRRTRPVRARDPFDIARSELSAGRPNRAIELLTAELARDPSPRGRFVRQTQIAYIMVEAGLFAVAQPILQKLVETIDERTLEQWESGPLVAQPMALLYRVLGHTGGDDGERYQLYLRICRLDPLQAMSLQAP